MTLTPEQVEEIDRGNIWIGGYIGVRNDIRNLIETLRVKEKENGELREFVTKLDRLNTLGHWTEAEAGRLAFQLALEARQLLGIKEEEK